MAPALTQTAEPPNLTDTTCHTSEDSSAPNGVTSSYESLKEFDKDELSSGVTTSKGFLESKKRYYLSNSDCVAPDLAPPAFGWAVGRPLPSNTSPYLFNMDDLPQLSHDSCNKSIITNNKASSTHRDKKKCSQESSNPCTISSMMGIQSCITNVASAPIDIKKDCTMAPIASPLPLPLVNQVPHEESSPLLNQPSDLLNILGRDFDYMADIIDSLHGLLEMEPEVSGEPALVTSQPTLSPEDRAMSILAHLSERQRVLERRRLFLLRRLHRVTARGLGITVSSQLSHLIKHVNHVLEEKKKEMLSPRRGKREEAEPILSLEMLHKESMKSMSTSDLISLVRRVEASHNNLQNLSDSLGKKKPVAVVVSLPQSLCSQLDTVSSEVRAATCTHLSHDSDATESSSGGESCDEAEGYSKSPTSTSSSVNHKSIRKRAFYRYCRQRGWIASRWMWLQAHIADLDYKLQQNQKLHKHIQKNKGPVQLADNVAVKDRDPAHLDPHDPALTCIGSPTARTVLNGYHPSNKSEDTSASCTSKGCARTCGVEKVRRRRYVRPNMAMLNRSLGGIANSTNKVKVSSVLCKCVPPLTCILCLKSRTSNKNKLSVGNSLTLGKTEHKAFLNLCTSEKLAKVDHAFHPVLSQPYEMLQGEHYNAVMKSHDWQQKALVSRPVITSKEESNSISTVSQLEPFSKRKKREKDHKRNGRRRHTKDEGNERLIQLQNKRNLTEDEGDDPDDELSLQVSVGGSGLSSPCPSPSPLPEKEAKALQLEAKAARKQASTGRQKQNSTSNSYDINNIIIPCSMAASSRVELLQYKEIPTPKWRIEEIEPLVKSKTNIEEEEDVSEEAIISRHSRSEEMERKKFLQYLQTQVNSSRSSRSRRADSSGTNTPDHPLSPRPLEPVDSPPDTPFPGTSEDSNQSSLAFSSKPSSQTTVLTLSLSSLPSLQSSLLKSSDTEAKIPSIPMDCDESGSPFVNISSLRSQKNSTTPSSFLVSEAVPGLRTRRMLSNSTGSISSEKVRLPYSGDEGNEKGRASPFPCRHFPLNESEFEGLVVVENECDDASPASATASPHILTKSSVKTRPDLCITPNRFPPHSVAEVVVAPVETDVESGRDSPISELTDSAPEEEGPWDEGSSVDWTISAVNDNCGGLVLTVQRN